jgi:DNA-binding response OmpR family regulator|tara:strand:+ start:723 stop:1286 length:564 start_codon:yes stop_codon:yes gene_type:complete
MKIQNLIIYQLSSLYHILKEIDQELHFNIVKIQNENLLNNEIKNLKNYLIITKSKLENFGNQYVLEKIPIKISQLIEKLNIKFLRMQFSDQLEIKINDYLINLNTRELSSNDKKLKLTEKEISIILYLFKNKIPISIKELQANVWKYQPDIETHTVETHIYRLRKKIAKNFKDENFIISKKNGYKIK